MTEQERTDIERLRRRIAELDAEALVREGRITDLLSQVFDQEHEIRDYEAMRDVLTPTELRAGPGLEVECSFTPATDGVAGDFYVVTPGPDEGSTILAVGDVSGKGAESARRATFVRTSLATFAGFVDEPCRLLELANQVLVERAGPSTIFVTAVVAVMRPGERRLTWASAGHPPPLMLDSGELLNGFSPAPPLGIDPTISCQSGEVEMEPSAGVLLFTDGVIEAHRPREPMFGERRLAEVVRELAGSSPTAVVRLLESAVLEHTGKLLADDLCIVAARVSFAPPPFSVETARDGARATVAILGELDIATTPQLTDALASLEPGYDTLVVDLSRCTFFASSGISILLEQRQRAQQDGFELLVIKAPRDVQRMFDLAGLDDKLTFRDP